MLPLLYLYFVLTNSTLNNIELNHACYETFLQRAPYMIKCAGKSLHYIYLSSTSSLNPDYPDKESLSCLTPTLLHPSLKIGRNNPRRKFKVAERMATLFVCSIN